MHSQPPRDRRPRPAISLVLATLGDDERLARLFATLRTQTFGDFEVIVVDQSGDDRLEALVDAHRSALNLRHLRHARGLSRSRNAGLRIAAGDIVCFPDDDCWYDPDVLERVHRYLAAHPHIDGLTGRAVFAKPERAPARFARRAQWVAPARVWTQGISCTIFLRRALVARIGPFDEGLGLGAGTAWIAAEESEYLLRAVKHQARIWYDPHLTVHHPGRRRPFTAGDPPELLTGIRERFGDHPVFSCDTHGETIDGYRRLLENLVQGLRAKSAFVPELLAREPWDLFACTFSESHCAGHQFWHFQDPRHPWHDASAPADLREALGSVYEAIDGGVGKVLSAAGDEATVLAVFSHGIDLYFDGPQLLPEVLVRLGVASGGVGRTGGWLRELKTRITYLPRPLKKVIKRLVRSAALQAPVAAAGCLVDPFESPRTRAAFVSNNRCGAIRLNLRGREPHGSVEPGEEAAALIAYLKRELSALRDPASGEPIVARVVTSDEQFGADHHPDLPDLICVFRTDLGMLERCVSPAVGEVHVPVYHPHAPRSGDHTINSRAWVSGPGIRPGGVATAANVLDIAPTVLCALGVTLPEWLDGRPLTLNESPADVRRSLALAGTA